MTEQQKERARERKRLWVKTHPEQVNAAGRRRYQRDLDESRGKKRVQVHRRLEAGCCTWCSQPRESNVMFCAFHREANRVKVSIAYYRRVGRPPPERLVQAQAALKLRRR